MSLLGQSHESFANIEQNQEELELYWTIERMQSAQPLPLLVKSINSTFTDHSGQACNIPLTRVDQPLLNIFPFSTMGKIFFANAQGLNFVCSGGVVTSTGGNLITTAAHCIFNVDRTFVRNLVFVPQYRNGIAPFGVFAARSFHWDNCWLDSFQQDFTVDLAFVIVNNAIEPSTQAMGITTEVSMTNLLRTAGYPANIENGEFLYQCSGVTCDTNGAFFRCNVQGPPNWSLGCQTSGGFSGGPYYNSDNMIVGVESHSTLDFNPKGEWKPSLFYIWTEAPMTEDQLKRW